ncbi:MAG TPA: hypothetical protein VNS79_08615 [Sphingobium sp.]|nr:hypothetical protein [Sphingobium sp.]
MIRPLVPLALLAALAACGSRTSLHPEPGMTAVPKAAAADRALTADELMRPSTQAQPGRQSDLIGRSVARKADPFDLPPGAHDGEAGAPADVTTVPRPDNVAADERGSDGPSSTRHERTNPFASTPAAPDNQ